MEPIATELEKKARGFRIDMLRAVNHANAGHTGGSLSEMDILTALYFHVLNVDPQNPAWPDRDRFILSKGHASIGLYTVLAGRGYFSKDELCTFDSIGTRLQAHPDMRKCPGIDYSTGSLGQGLSVAIGIALGASMAGKNFTTFVLLGDGESQEGQVWEALMYAGNRRVKNLVAIFDYNKVQLSSSLQDNVDIQPLDEKLSAFRWKYLKVDGHNMLSLLKTLDEAKRLSAEGPVAVIAHTVKGKGVSFMENKYKWHGAAPNDEELALAVSELEGMSK